MTQKVDAKRGKGVSCIVFFGFLNTGNGLKGGEAANRRREACSHIMQTFQKRIFNMNFHGFSTAVNGNGNGNGVDGTRADRLIISWTLAEFKQAARKAGYEGVRLFYSESPPQCQFPLCIMRNADIEEIFGEDQGVCVWRVTAPGEEPRLVLWCKHHQWTDIKRGDDYGCVVEPVVMGESDMIPLFARAAGFYLVKNQDSIPMHVAVA